MDESALRRALASLEDCSTSLHWWLGLATLLVVTGVALELVFVVWEYRDDLHDFRRGIIRPPDKPGRLLFILGFLGAGLVAVGVGGELYVESKIATTETCIRKGNDALFLLLSKLAGDASASAKVAYEKAKAAEGSASRANLYATQAEQRALRVERENAIRDIPAKDQPGISKSLSKFVGEECEIDVFPVDFGSAVLAWSIEGILVNAGWKASPPNLLPSPLILSTISPAGVEPSVSTAPITVSGIFIFSTGDSKSRAAAELLRSILNSHPIDLSASVGGNPLAGPKNPRVLVHVGSSPHPLRQWVK